MKKRIKSILALMILCIMTIFCSSCSLIESLFDEDIKVSTRHSSVEFDFNNLWEMEFPEEFSPVFIFYERGGWQGEGGFSAIYECEQPSEEFLKDFSVDMNEEVKEQMPDFNYYYENREQLEEEYDITINLDSAYLPDFNNEFISVAYHTTGHHSYKDEFIVYIGKDNCEGHYCDDHLYMCYFPERKLLYIHEDIT